MGKKKIEKGGIHTHVYDCLDELWDVYEQDFLVEYKVSAKINWTNFDHEYWSNVYDETEWEKGWYLVENYGVEKLEEWLDTFKKLKRKEMHILHSL